MKEREKEMEATKERMEKEHKREVTNEAGKAEDTVRGIIRESIVETRGASDGDKEGGGGGGARKPEDILVFSRTVRKIDSSLE